MRKRMIIVMVALCTLLCGCGSTGVSQEEYEKVVAERDEYKAQLESLGGLEESKSVSPQENTTVQESKVDYRTDDLMSQVEVVAEYSYENSIGSTVYCMVIKNNSDFTVSVENNVTAYDQDENIMGASSASENAIGSGYEVCLINNFRDNENVADFKYSLSVKEEDWYEQVQSDLEYQVSKQDKKAIVTCTNNGSKAAEFVEATALFFSNGELIRADRTYITDDDSELKPGATLSKEVSCYGSYDDVLVYLTGRR